jgi:hypothetical protein
MVSARLQAHQASAVDNGETPERFSHHTAPERWMSGVNYVCVAADLS